jgi:hypothetical protein
VTPDNAPTTLHLFRLMYSRCGDTGRPQQKLSGHAAAALHWGSTALNAIIFLALLSSYAAAR